MSALRECPFCGSEDIYHTQGYHDRYVKCRRCGAQGPRQERHILAAKHWNARVGVQGDVAAQVSKPDTVTVYQVFREDLNAWVDTNWADSSIYKRNGYEVRELAMAPPQDQNPEAIIPTQTKSNDQFDDKTRQICRQTVDEMFRVAMGFLNYFVEHMEQKRDKTQE